MHNVPSPSAYLYKTPHAPSHAHYTPLAFSLGFPPHDHALFLPQRPASYAPAPGAVARTGYPYASSSDFAPHAPYPGTPPVPRPYHHKAPPHPVLTEQEPDEPATSTIMAITLPYSRHAHPQSSSESGGSHHGGGGGGGSGSDGGRDPTPPEEQQRAKDAKKKIHHCWMCHKSFDRPSTLKKHLLVHTGEKAFACESCGRRFGVASNLNRHAKTCRAANPGASATPAAGSSSPAASTSQAAAASPSTSTDGSAAAGSSTSSLSISVVPAGSAPPAGAAATATADTPVATPAAPRRSARKRKATAAEDPSTPSEMPPTAERQTRSRKRARRAPSPSLWVPESLKAFDLTPLAKCTPVPLPPVRPLQENGQFIEERDSFDENASANPYHPRGWNGRLPGPGLMGTNVANRSGGQLLIF